MNLFMGHFDSVLNEILKYISIDHVIVEEKKANSAVIELCIERNISFTVIKDFAGILSVMELLESVQLCFVASFGIILKEPFIKRCEQIVNFHLGDVENCRGRHPLPSAILNRHTSMGVTVHLINSERIDAGPILAKLLMTINYSESYLYNEIRLIRAATRLAALVMDDYLQCGRMIAYEWNVVSSQYYSPLEGEILKIIIESKRLEDIFHL